MRSVMTVSTIILLLIGTAGSTLANCACADWKNTDNYNLTVGQTYMDPDGRIAVTVHDAGEVEVTNPFIAQRLKDRGHKVLGFLVTIRNGTDYVIDVLLSRFWVEDEWGHKFAAELVGLDNAFDGSQIRPMSQRRGYVTVPVPAELDLANIVFVYDMGASPTDVKNAFIRNDEYAVYRFTQD